MGSRFTRESCTASDRERESTTAIKDRPGRLVPHPCETSALRPSTSPPRSVGGGAYSVAAGGAPAAGTHERSVDFTLRRWTLGIVGGEWKSRRRATGAGQDAGGRRAARRLPSRSQARAGARGSIRAA